MATSFPSHRDLFVHSAYGELDGQVVTITQDQIVECSTSDAKFCFSAVEDMDYKGDELKATFRGCNADPIYGKVQGDSDGQVINECTQDGDTPVNIPGVITADLTCCSTNGCNDGGGAPPGGDGGSPGQGGHHTGGTSTFGLSLLTIIVACLAQAAF
ncbi:hypothetical protein AAVH_18223 [Aphelenchoides avenae]|nr:hypothetical protein AAVH_18223 [Aphelenchus avenae]